MTDAFSQLKSQAKTDGPPVIAIKIGTVDANGKTNVSVPASVFLEGMKSVPIAVIRINSDKESYSLPLQVLDLQAIAKSLGTDSTSVTLHINISVMGTDIEKLIQASAGVKGASSLGHSVDFSVTAERNGKTQELNNFGTNYVDRSITYSGPVDPKTSTGILYDPTSHMAVMVAKAISAAGKTAASQTGLLNKFNDNSQISDWAKASVSQSVQADIITGMTDITFVPKANASRAQAVVMLKRLLQYVQFIN